MLQEFLGFLIPHGINIFKLKRESHEIICLIADERWSAGKHAEQIPGSVLPTLYVNPGHGQPKVRTKLT
jgi:hypothetical protein